MVRTPAERGFVLAAIASAAFAFALSSHETIVTNFFEHELGLAGPQFGYITAIREIPGFLLIFLTAVFYRLSLPRLTAGAMMLLATGFFFFGTATSFWTVAPWVVVSSMGYHTFLQTQHALGLSLTTQDRAGYVLGRLAAVSAGGSLAAMAFVFVVFQTGWLSFRETFIVCAVAALVAAAAVVTFPNLRDGQPERVVPRRDPIVLRWSYRYYYLLNLLDGGRQQIFFSFGLWVLVHRFGLGVPTISAILIATTALRMLTSARIGGLVDRYGERQMLAMINVGYVLALVGYALVDSVAVAVLCYVAYSFMFPLSAMGASVYLRKVAEPADLAPSLAMGITMQHVAAIAVPLATGYVLNYVGYQVPFLVASVFAILTFLATSRLSYETGRVTRPAGGLAQA